MNLRYTLPETEQETLRPLLGGQRIVYCVPYDIRPDGTYDGSGWLAVSERALYLLSGGELEKTVPLAEIDELVCVPQIDNGVLLYKHGEEEMLLCRFSMRHMVRHSYVARGVTALCKGEAHEVYSAEKERYCPHCGRVLPGTNLCPRCDGRGRSWRRLGNLCKGYVGPLLLLTLFMLIISGIAIGQQFVQREFIDRVLVPAKGSWGFIALFFGIMLTFLIVSLTLTVLRTYWSNRLGTRISCDLRERVFAKINSLSLSFLDSRQTGELMNRVVDDSGKIRQFMEEIFAGMFTQLFIMIGAVVAMLFIHWKLALLTLVMLPLAAIVVRLFRVYEKRLWRQQWRFNDRINGRLQDVISGIRVVKSFGQEQRETERFDSYTDRMTSIQRRNEIFWATLYPFVTFLLTMGSFFVLYFGGLDVLDGSMTPGQLTQLVAYAGMLYGPLGWMTRLPRMLMQVATSLERIYDILDEESDVVDAEQAQPHDIKGEIVFDNVSFGYKSYLPVLENISFTVKPGEMIGLVGSSGSGKSTLINLLMRLYDVDGGEIRIDGKPVQAIRQEDYHRQIGVVLQETFLFSGTIYDNIRYAKPDAVQEDVMQAAKMANAHTFITQFPDGYDTYVGENGYTLSGGERQRIAIARAILHNPQLLILDEATSSLDTETEYQIQEAFSRLTAGRTTFAIAHRLSTLRNADRILVIDKHKLAEIGSHNELMRQKGIYYGLVMAQLDMHRVKAE